MIDCHTHIFSPFVRERRGQLAQEDPFFSLIYTNTNAWMIGVEELVQTMEQEGVEASVACGFPWHQPELCRRENDYLLECSRRYPEMGGRFFFYKLMQEIATLCQADLPRSTLHYRSWTYRVRLWLSSHPFFEIRHCNEGGRHP